MIYIGLVMVRPRDIILCILISIDKVHFSNNVKLLTISAIRENALRNFVHSIKEMILPYMFTAITSVKIVP
jgi:hypothetical protein